MKCRKIAEQIVCQSLSQHNADNGHDKKVQQGAD